MRTKAVKTISIIGIIMIIIATIKYAMPRKKYGKLDLYRW